MSSRPHHTRSLSLTSGILLLTVLLTGSCSKKTDQPAALSPNADILSFRLFPPHDTVNLTAYNHSVTIHVPDTIASGNNLAALFSLSPGATATVNSTPQTSGVTTNNFETDLTYEVTAADHTTKKNWTVQATNNGYSLDWGLGHFVGKALGNNRNYEWYIDQGYTGPASGYNCGPASVTMAIRWSDSSFTHTAADARAFAYNSGGWWYTSDIDSYLQTNNIPFATVSLAADAMTTGQILAQEIDNGQIVICCIDMNYVRAAASYNFHVDKFYATTPGWGHFFVVKGYQRIDGQLFFQIYDPYSYGLTNSDGTIRGKDRFYRFSDVAAATSGWWNYAIVVGKKGHPLSAGTSRRALNPASIPRGHSIGTLSSAVFSIN
jgi:hypothetical protein